MLNDIILSVGSNVRPYENIDAAYNLLKSNNLNITSSFVYESYAVENNDVKKELTSFFNAVFRVKTPKTLEEIVDITNQVEDYLGRVKVDDKFSNIPIDIDVIFYGQHIMQYRNKIISDKNVVLYEHIFLPLMDVAADFIHPIFNVPLKQLVHQQRINNVKKKVSIDK